MTWYVIILLVFGYFVLGSLTTHYLPKIIPWIDDDDSIWFGMVWPIIWLVGIPIGGVYLFITLIVEGLFLLDDFWDFLDDTFEKLFRKK